MKKTVRVLTGLGQERVMAADTDIAADRIEDTADRDGRVHICFQENVGSHGGGCRFAVRSGNGNRRFEVVHHLAEQFGTGEHRDLFCYRSGIFRIVRVDGGCVDHQIRCVIQVGSTLTVVENGSFGFQLLCELVFVGIGAGYFEMLLQ